MPATTTAAEAGPGKTAAGPTGRPGGPISTEEQHDTDGRAWSIATAVAGEPPRMGYRPHESPWPRPRLSTQVPTSIRARACLALRGPLWLPRQLGGAFALGRKALPSAAYGLVMRHLRSHGWAPEDLLNPDAFEEMARAAERSATAELSVNLRVARETLQDRWSRTAAYVETNRALGITTLCRDDADYPQLLHARLGTKAPGWLHVRGNMNSLNPQRQTGTAWPLVVAATAWSQPADASTRPRVAIGEWTHELAGQAVPAGPSWWVTDGELRSATPPNEYAVVLSRNEPAAAPSAKARGMVRELIERMLNP